MSDNENAALLEQSKDAIRAKDFERARELLQELTDNDPENAMAWLLLARVVDDENEKRICLANVLQIDPGNARAEKMLAKLDATEEATGGSSEEVWPGIKRRTLTVVIAACVAFGLVSCLIVIVLANGINASEAEAATKAARAIINVTQTEDAVRAAATQAAAEATEQMMAETATAEASITPTLTLTRTPNLPPSSTPTLTPVGITTPEPLDPPPALAGKLVLWGGRDIFSNDFLELGVIDLVAGGYQSPTIVNDDSVRFPTIDSAGERIVYMRFDRGDWSLYAVNLDGNQQIALAARWGAAAQIRSPKMPRFSNNGQQIVFIGTDVNENVDHVYLFNFEDDSVTRITNDGANYSYPSMSVDGQIVYAVRDDPANPGPDLVAIAAVPPYNITPITSDLGEMVESSPSASVDGRLVIYSAAPATDPDNHDIFWKLSDGRGDSGTIYATDADEIYPIFSPTGDYIAFTSNRSTLYDAYIFELEEGTLWQVTQGEDEDYIGGWSAQ